MQFISFHIMFINVPSQQPDDQLQKRRIIDINNKGQYTGNIRNMYIQNKGEKKIKVLISVSYNIKLVMDRGLFKVSELLHTLTKKDLLLILKLRLAK
jgi:hypothetical protein